MDEQVNRLVEKTWAKYQSTAPSQRLMIAISGIPGSGKTTLAALVAKRVNTLYDTINPGLSSTEKVAAFIPMDGYHLSRAQLSALPDPDTANARRGAAFTFDGHKFLALVKELRKPLMPESRTLYAPSFDHAIKDPVENDIPIHPYARIILFEGNYLSLGKDEWREAAGLMDELWFVDVDFEVARRRLVKRHVKAGIAVDEGAAHKRVSENDLVNGKEIVEDRLQVDEIIISKEDDAWRPEAQGVGDEMSDDIGTSTNDKR